MSIESRPFSKNYSGLVNQSVVGVGLLVVCVSAHEFMKRKRRGNHRGEEGLGSVESWEFGYLYQGRSWAKRPSPPHPRGWPLSWVKEVLLFPDNKVNELRGVDASVYLRWLKGCWWFLLLHVLTTFLILFPVHVKLAPSYVSPKSMTRASITSLVGSEKGDSLLWIHICLLFWVTLTWMGTLFWITRGAYRFRAQKIQATADRVASETEVEKESQWCPHPHPQFPFQALPSLDHENWSRGLRLRTVMVTNVPPQLRSEKELKDYFQYYLSRPLDMPSMGLTSSTPPGFWNKILAFLFNRAKTIPSKLPLPMTFSRTEAQDFAAATEAGRDASSCTDGLERPSIDRVVIARKMTELASLLERREEVLKRLETAHIKLAKKALTEVKAAMDLEDAAGKPRKRSMDKLTSSPVSDVDVERGDHAREASVEGEDRTDLLIRTLGPFVQEFGLRKQSRFGRRKLQKVADPHSGKDTAVEMECPKQARDDKTIWEALLSLPRSTLDAFQPLIHLSALFRGKTVPSIDYYTAKLGLLTALITENRARAVSDYDPCSTAFVTFTNPDDARRACKYLAVHPDNPLACLVTMAPSYEDIDWIRLMKSTFRAEFLKDWIVDVGVWTFTIFWLIPVSFFVTLVSIQNVQTYWPWLNRYLSHHPWEQEVLQSFVPTVFISLLTITVPLILLLIAKKAHTIITLSALHDKIMTRYYKFLIVNVLVFFCLGTFVLQSFLINFTETAGGLINTVAGSFPAAGPFYVGWLIFTTAMHGGVELALLGLPLIMYPSTRRQVTPRKRAVGIRPRTFNYYYWLPNHLLVIHILLLFAVLQPLVLPFGLLYFCVEVAVIRNQLIHVYARNYEGNGQTMLIRMIRYSLDGLIFAQAVFMAYMTVLKKHVNIGLAAFLIVFTVIVKLVATRLVRARFEYDDVLEARILCGTGETVPLPDSPSTSSLGTPDPEAPVRGPSEPFNNHQDSHIWSWKLPMKFNFSYATVPSRPRRAARHQPNPFGPHQRPFSRLHSFDISQKREHQRRDVSPTTAERASMSMPALERTTSPLEEETPAIIPDTSSHALVTRHPPHPTWDDESNPDHPYDNPYYTQPIRNVLWLPRNPVGILDLDDTVDVHRALTSEPGVDQLGEWPTEQAATIATGLSGLGLSTITSFSNPDLDGMSLSPSRRFTGDESISLRTGLASRVEAIEKEEDVEIAVDPQAHSRFARRRTGSDHRTPSSASRQGSLGLGRPSTFAGMRSFSSASGSRHPPQRRASSVLSTADPRLHPRSASMSQDIDARPDFHAQAEFAKSTLSMVSSSPRLMSGDRLPIGSSAISTQEAVLHEVIKEEQEAAEDRLRREQEEAQASAKAGSVWWTAWMFRRAR
ncbi:hypothetical protein GLOTRDRAFT_121604 [Gloeophyllum trabeum ATCC 11539]|uniref:DUF221-domain-containing protein n=1 Tax=Gloeophyllum trabeum (strain ATCC 11539 / FP-39264 / Madison 617) TaxID=670483 RepID=S7Q359_GLOTA|nr:uncharacterized protein GLOTRDRAFT_121604 [Gloeophyllum trabeum ATCC 11539]EPQ54451.1 hypothetical protein GLOTRDRAFT_121604 [Gloeophyllum trabeum ATCC 11539]